MKIAVELTCAACDGDGCDNCDDGTATVELPAKYEVCGTCRGNGSHVNPAIDGNGLTAEDFAEDPDFEEAYFRGDYDQTCEECHGQRVVPVVDFDVCTPEQKKLAHAAQERAAERARWDAEDAHTRRMEGGGW